MTLTVGPISGVGRSAYVHTQGSVSLLPTAAWDRGKSGVRRESLGRYDGRQLVGADLVLHREVPRLERSTLTCRAEGPTTTGPAMSTRGSIRWRPLRFQGDQLNVGRPPAFCELQPRRGAR